MKAVLVGIAGVTCSGKSTLLANLKKEFGNGVTTYTFEEYFIGLDKYDVEKITNFEKPKLWDFKRFTEDLKKLKNGQSLVVRSNSRESQISGIKFKTIVSRPLIIVEGFLIFHDDKARNLFDKKIFIEIPDAEVIKRRYTRTKASKHWDSLDYINNKIIPYHHKYVEPQKGYCDLVIDGMRSQLDMTNEAINFIMDE